MKSKDTNQPIKMPSINLKRKLILVKYACLDFAIVFQSFYCVDFHSKENEDTSGRLEEILFI